MTEAQFIKLHTSKGWTYKAGEETLSLEFNGHQLEWLLGEVTAHLHIKTNTGVEHELRLKYHSAADDLAAIKSVIPDLLKFSWEELDVVGL